MPRKRGIDKSSPPTDPDPPLPSIPKRRKPTSKPTRSTQPGQVGSAHALDNVTASLETFSLDAYAQPQGGTVPHDQYGPTAGPTPGQYLPYPSNHPERPGTYQSAQYGQSRTYQSAGYGQSGTNPSAPYGQHSSAYTSDQPRQSGTYPSDPPRQSGTYPSAGYGQPVINPSAPYGQHSSAFPSSQHGQYGAYTSDQPGQSGTYPSAGYGTSGINPSAQFGQSVTYPSAGYGQSLTNPSAQYGQSLTYPSAQYGQSLTYPSAGYGQHSAYPPSQHGQYGAYASDEPGQQQSHLWDDAKYQKLIDFKEQYDMEHGKWNLIAEAMSTEFKQNITSHDCERRWNSEEGKAKRKFLAANPTSFDRSAPSDVGWSQKEEDELVWLKGQYDHRKDKWALVAQGLYRAKFFRHTADDCQKRWNNKLKATAKNLKPEDWSEEEDNRLTELVKGYKKWDTLTGWDEISEQMSLAGPRRAPENHRTRWQEIRGPANFGDYTEAEENLILTFGSQFKPDELADILERQLHSIRDPDHIRATRDRLAKGYGRIFKAGQRRG